MNKIIKLPKQISDKIAAGEVVTGPVSVVKELVENSIDAGADSITVEIREGGKTYIRVSDNGSGISSDEVNLAFSPHATSKIVSEDDLDNINTLGFRGEALTSIAAVSKLEMITMTADSRIGRSIFILGGDVVEEKDTGANPGTTIIVKDLYFNTPARLKFMKSDRSESTKIIDLISRFAIAYPTIKIRMINNQNILFSTSGKGDVLSNIYQVYGEMSGGELLEIKEKQDGCSLKAYISSSNLTKKTRRNQIYFVNGRVVNSKIIENAISKGYEEFIFEGRYPLAYVFLDVDPKKLDVNVHPAKTEVRFDENAIVSEFIYRSIHNRLKTGDAIPSAAASSKSKKIQKENLFKLDKTTDTDFDTKNSEDTVKQVNIKSLLSNNPEKSNYKDRSETEIVADSAQSAYDDVHDSHSDKAAKGPDIGNLNILGTVFATYILATDEDVFYIIDQHAAHERVSYEIFLKQYNSHEKLSQQILEPLIRNLPRVSFNYMDDWIELINKLGYEVEIFGDNSLIVRAVPAFLELVSAENMLDDILDEAGHKVPQNDKAVEKLIQRSCKASVKANDLLKPAEIKTLLEDLDKCDNPFACPHGRPVFIKLTRYDVEKLFRRV